MNIISRIKDYYDFVVFETDNRKVFERHPQIIKFNVDPIKWKEIALSQGKKIEDYYPIDISGDLSGIKKFVYSSEIVNHSDIDFSFFVVCFCGNAYQGVYDGNNNEFIYSFDKIPKHILNYFENKNLIKTRYNRFHDVRSALNDYQNTKKKKDNWIFGWIKNRHKLFDVLPTDLNKKLNSPVIVLNHPLKVYMDGNIRNAILEDIKFAKVIPPSEAYQSIYNFIPYPEPEMPSSPDDMARYESKGFDKKTSFRPNIKPKK